MNCINIRRKSLSLYVHIPFCVKKCNYCDFLSGPATEETKRSYVKALCKEISAYTKIADQYEVKTIFIGGGTPSSIKATEIKQIMNTIINVFQISKEQLEQIETTIEINPGTITDEKMKTYYECGINRISFGLQSANDRELKMLGRIHTFEEFVMNYELARNIGFMNINIDLMSALPGQTKDSYINTLQKVLALHPEHISAYSLIIEEGTPFYELYGENATGKQKEALPSEEEERAMYEVTKTILSQYGYERYEISNYAKADYECKHNCVYWQRGEYLGFGTGAASLLKENRFTNIADIKEYIDLLSTNQSDFDLSRLRLETTKLDQASQMEEFMFLGLRMMNGVSKKRFQETFHKKIEEVYGQVLHKLEEEQLIIISEDGIALTERGIDISNYVMSEFLFG